MICIREWTESGYIHTTQHNTPLIIRIQDNHLLQCNYIKMSTYK